jgi:hypothetical protein
MELVVEADKYSPSTDENGNYIDKIPSFSLIKNGLLCPCGSRKDKYYHSHSSFSTHTKTKVHQNWLSTINLNKVNYYIENEKMLEIIQNQRLIIARIEKEVNNKNITITYLTDQLTKQNCKTVNNLLDMDF